MRIFNNVFPVLLSSLLVCACIELSNWGNKITFVNELGVEIDSLAFWVCGEKSTLLSFETETGESYIDENPRFPASGYPCPIEIIVYARGRQLVLQADTFDCYECDNAKYYILRDSRAIFQTHGALEE